MFSAIEAWKGDVELLQRLAGREPCCLDAGLAAGLSRLLVSVLNTTARTWPWGRGTGRRQERRFAPRHEGRNGGPP